MKTLPTNILIDIAGMSTDDEKYADMLMDTLKQNNYVQWPQEERLEPRMYKMHTILTLDRYGSRGFYHSVGQATYHTTSEDAVEVTLKELENFARNI